MPVCIAPRSNGHEFQVPDSCEPGTENLQQPGAFKLRCIDHVVSCLSLAQLIVLC